MGFRSATPDRKAFKSSPVCRFVVIAVDLPGVHIQCRVCRSQYPTVKRALLCLGVSTSSSNATEKSSKEIQLFPSASVSSEFSPSRNLPVRSPSLNTALMGSAWSSRGHSRRARRQGKAYPVGPRPSPTPAFLQNGAYQEQGCREPLPDFRHRQRPGSASLLIAAQRQSALQDRRCEKVRCLQPLHALQAGTRVLRIDPRPRIPTGSDRGLWCPTIHALFP